MKLIGQLAAQTCGHLSQVKWTNGDGDDGDDGDDGECDACDAGDDVDNVDDDDNDDVNNCPADNLCR